MTWEEIGLAWEATWNVEHAEASSRFVNPLDMRNEKAHNSSTNHVGDA